jgi:ribosomal protein S18 acetylase RimI-like enzyme
MSVSQPVAKIWRATAEDADAITSVYLESAQHHATIDPERYTIPSREFISERYRNGRQYQADADSVVVTLVAESGGEIVGFVDARLDRSPDPMHKDLIYCHIIEIAVAERKRSQGIGEQLLRAAEDWGREHRAQLASLEYNAANTRAAAFYQQRMGFRVASITAIKRL